MIYFISFEEDMVFLSFYVKSVVVPFLPFFIHKSFPYNIVTKLSFF